MTYLPISDIGERSMYDPARFGAAASNMADLQMHLAQIRECWLYHPTIQYSALLKATPLVVRPTTTAPATKLGGESGGTRYDPLWGEAVPSSLDTWAQPHSAPALIDASPNPTNPVTPSAAANPEVYTDAVDVHASISRDLPKSSLQKFGFDRVRGLIVTIPTVLLDDLGITAQAGDRLVWDNETYSVIQQTFQGYWMNTNTRLYVVLNCEHLRIGG